jgi:hypothetical protein
MNRAIHRAFWNARGFAGFNDFYSCSMNRRMPNGTWCGRTGAGMHLLPDSMLGSRQS